MHDRVGAASVRPKTTSKTALDGGDHRTLGHLGFDGVADYRDFHRIDHEGDVAMSAMMKPCNFAIIGTDSKCGDVADNSVCYHATRHEHCDFCDKPPASSGCAACEREMENDSFFTRAISKTNP